MKYAKPLLARHAPVQGHDIFNSLWPPWSNLSVRIPGPQPAIRFDNRNVLAPLLLPAHEVYADVILVAPNNKSLEPLSFIIRGVDLLPLRQRRDERDFSRGFVDNAGVGCGGRLRLRA